MVKRYSSTAALNDILSSSESDDKNDKCYSDELDVGSDIDNRVVMTQIVKARIVK